MHVQVVVGNSIAIVMKPLTPKNKVQSLGQTQVDLLENDPDWVYSKKFGYSALAAADKYPEGVPDRLICGMLHLTQEELDCLWEEIVSELRSSMGVNDE